MLQIAIAGIAHPDEFRSVHRMAGNVRLSLCAWLTEQFATLSTMVSLHKEKEDMGERTAYEPLQEEEEEEEGERRGGLHTLRTMVKGFLQLLQFVAPEFGCQALHPPLSCVCLL